VTRLPHPPETAFQAGGHQSSPGASTLGPWSAAHPPPWASKRRQQPPGAAGPPRHHGVVLRRGWTRADSRL